LLRRGDQAAFRARLSVGKSGPRTTTREFVPRCPTAATSLALFILRERRDFVIISTRGLLMSARFECTALFYHYVHYVA
jgi:hypothetical protein